MRLNIDLSPNDGKLVLFAIRGKGRVSLLSILPQLYSGRAVARDDVFIRKCSRLNIRCAEKKEIEFDGDPRGFLPADIEILPTALDLIGAKNERI